ncbi:MAG: dynamin family protein [Acidobacteria bacterium]|nr:dynamin family protein [Acidobacteriota bacterium]
MPDEAAAEATAGGLNGNHQRRLIVTCQYIDGLLATIETVLATAGNGSPFGKYADDLLPAQKRVAEDSVRRIRAQMVRLLASHGLEPTPRQVDASHAIRTALAFSDDAVEELKPSYMRGYGDVSAEAAATLNAIAEELQATIRRLDVTLAQRSAADLRERINRLPEHAPLETLRTLERVIDKYGLVEFRPLLSTILQAFEEQHFEIAVFGRVSTGKSSLLNHVLGRAVLPVGVNPITSVPTRIAYGDRQRLRVWRANQPVLDTSLDALAQFITETGNPGNQLAVTRIVVELPAAPLKSGIVFVDTPGVGSLARASTSETLAYLPRCDVGIVLIDASSTIAADDVEMLRRLASAGIPAHVLLSKADLASDADLERARAYAASTVRGQLGADTAVYPVSVQPERAALFERWRHEELEPLMERHRELARESVARKVTILADAVSSFLRRRLSSRRPGPTTAPDLSGVERALQTGAARIQTLQQRAEAIADSVRGWRSTLLGLASRAIAGDTEPNAAVARAFSDVARHVADAVRSEFVATVGDVRATLDSAAATGPIAAGALTFDVDRELRELPVPELPTVRVSPPSALRWFGRAATTRLIKRHLDSAVGDALTDALATYGEILRAWVKTTLGRVRHAWEIDVEQVRASMDRARGFADERPVDAVEVQRDLDALQRGAAA